MPETNPALEQASADEALLQRIRDNRKYALAEWDDNFREGDEDMRHLSVKGGWPERDRKQRESEGRPCGHTDIISQHCNRVINHARMNKRGVKIVPDGPGASP